MLKINKVGYTGSYKLKVSLSNGTEGLFDVSPYITKGFFKQLANEHYLKQVKVDESGIGICWPDEQDFSIDTLEAELVLGY